LPFKFENQKTMNRTVKIRKLWKGGDDNKAILSLIPFVTTQIVLL